MDQMQLTPLGANELNALTLIEASVFNAEDEKIGKVSHVYGEGLGVELIVDIGGTLLIGPKPVSLTQSQLEFSRDANGTIHIKTSLSDAQLGLLLEYTPPERR